MSTARVRARGGLPEFSLDADFQELCDPHYGLVDKVEYKIWVPVRFASASRGLNEFAGVIYDPRRNDNIAKKPNNGLGTSKKITIAEAWLFSGSGTLRRLSRIGLGDEGFLSLHLSLNPTRFRAVVGRAAADQAPAEVLRRSVQQLHELPATLDGNDNALQMPAKPGRRMMMGSIVTFERGAQTYESLVEALINDRFRVRVKDAGCAEVAELRLGSPTAIETYFEFWSAEAVRVVATIAQAARAMISDVSVTAWPQRRVTLLPQINSLSVKFALSGSIELTIYAKDPQRIRMEIRDSAPSRRPEHKRKEDASKRIIKFLEALKAYRRQAVRPKNVINLMKAVQVAEPDERRADALLSLLLTEGGITMAGNRIYSGAVDRLKENKVLRSLRVRHGAADRVRGRRYCLTSAYVEAVEAFGLCAIES